MIKLSAFERSPKLSELKVTYRRTGLASARKQITGAMDAAEYLKSVWDRDRIELVEEFVMLCLDGGNRPNGWLKVSTGGSPRAPSTSASCSRSATPDRVARAHRRPLPPERELHAVPRRRRPDEAAEGRLGTARNPAPRPPHHHEGFFLQPPRPRLPVRTGRVSRSPVGRTARGPCEVHAPGGPRRGRRPARAEGARARPALASRPRARGVQIRVGTPVATRPPPVLRDVLHANDRDSA